VVFGLLGQHEHQLVLEAGAFALVADSIGFAPFNFPTARVFLADVGATSLVPGWPCCSSSACGDRSRQRR
jgi:UDP-N-acetylmuramyl pentapeptide phosphotransferase/UDP-N-acetylglucosamine-1-phosphate transferase